jgi:hypothetical protein
MKRNKIWRFMIILLIIIVAALLYLYKEYNRTNKDTAGLTPDYTVPASSIIKEFETDESLAGRKYTDKIILAHGFIKDLLKDDRGFYSVMLGDTTSMSSVKCSMDSIYNEMALTLQKGTYATVKGVCAGFNADELLGSDVILVRCVIDKNKK